MPVSRRTLVAATGGLALIGAGGLWRVLQTPQQAFEPWGVPSSTSGDPRLDIFRHAILAPNPHNRQPWIIRLDGDDRVTLFCDLDRRLPRTDPFDRQITIGFGCLLALAHIAAAQRGLRLETDWFPQGEPQPRLDSRPIAQLRVVADTSLNPDPLFAAIPLRRSTKTVYQDRPVHAGDLTLIEREASGLGATSPRIAAEATPARVAAIRSLVLKALAIETQTPRTHRESVDLMRIGAREVDASPDGIALLGPGIEAMAATGLISRKTLADPASTAFRQGKALLAETHGSAPAFLSVITAGNSRADQLAAGEVYARANLRATALGLAMHPMSQALQEYPEMAGVYADMHRLVAPAGGRIQMLARIGHAAAVPPSPRWPLSTRLAPSPSQDA